MAEGRWIAVDWGTSNLRIWMMDGALSASAAQSEQGMASLAWDGFEPALLDLIGPNLGDGQTLVICCGMVGSCQGWAEAEYLSVPCPPQNTQAMTRVPTADPRLDVAILPGLKQQTPPDVMRGEETQIAGFLAMQPDFDGILCLTGTHTKWAHISAGEIVSFKTFMTGELFSLLSERSVLRHSLTTEDFDQPAFLSAVSDSLSRPQTLAADLFGLRAGSLVAGLDPAVARARLSGLLIGAELGAARPYWLGQNVAIIGATDLAGLYQAGLAEQGVQAETHDAPAMTLAGLTAAYRAMQRPD